LSVFGGAGANILTMNQNIPVSGTASISVTAQIAELEMTLDEFLGQLRAVDGVINVDFITGE
jgi:chorismate mutase